MNSNIIGGLTVAVLALALVLGGFGAGSALGHGVGGTTTVTATQTVINSSAPYVLHLVITTNSIFNSTAQDQPGYFVVGPNGLESSAKIALPVNRTIELVIVNYDDGNASFTQPNINAVTGTIGNNIFIANNDNINSSESSNALILQGGQTVSSIPADAVAHTFSVPSLGLNIPVELSSTVVAYFKIAHAGDFTWFCLTACGDAAMQTAGWMTGTLAAS
jgi:heme/copper-type cytochrome/quinol oxidase subunit 2